MQLEGAELPTFDLVLLGMGRRWAYSVTVLPGTQAIDQVGRLVVANHVPQKGTWRITLTWPVINQGREVAFLIEGAAKADILAEVLLGPRDPEPRLPSGSAIRPNNGRLELLLDAAAAAKLPAPQDDRVGILELGR